MSLINRFNPILKDRKAQTAAGIMIMSTSQVEKNEDEQFVHLLE
jgi:hypothetical protein